METKIEETVISILKTSDMDNMTEFKVRNLAGQKLGIDLSTPPHKKLVRNVVEAFLISQQNEDDDDEEAVQPEPVEPVPVPITTITEEITEPEEDDDYDPVEEVEPEEEEEETKTSAQAKEHDDDGDLIICKLSNKRRVTIQNFKGRTLVSIREYYEKDGKQLPSSKGISLTAEQWSAFRKAVPGIEEAIKKIEMRMS